LTIAAAAAGDRLFQLLVNSARGNKTSDWADELVLYGAQLLRISQRFPPIIVRDR